MTGDSTHQENFWAGDFGDLYCDRNSGDRLRLNNVVFWAQIIRRIPHPPKSVLELGANIGLNLQVMAQLIGGVSLTGVEIDKKAAQELREWGGAEVIEGSLLDFRDERKWDLVFTKGVLENRVLSCNLCARLR